MAKKSTVGIISVEKPTWFPLIDDSSEFPIYDEPLTIGTAVSIKPTFNYETTPDYGDGVVQDQFTAFGGAEISLTTNGYKNEVLAGLTGSTLVGGGILRSGEDVAPDGAFAYRRKKSNGHYRYTILYKGQFILSSDETTTLEGTTVTFTHPEWTGTFVDVEGVGYMYSVDSDDPGVDSEVIKNWFKQVTKPTDAVEEESISIAVTPKTSTAVAGTLGTRQLTVKVLPEDMEDKSVTYKIEPDTQGLSVTSTGLISWTAEVPEGVYTTTVTTNHGTLTDTNVLTLTAE